MINRRKFLQWLGLTPTVAIIPSFVAEKPKCVAKVLEQSDYHVGSMVTNGTVVSVTITNSGSGYFDNPYYEHLISTQNRQLKLYDLPVRRESNAL